MEFEKAKLLNVPNVLTGLRILLIITFVGLFFALPYGSILPLAVFAVAGVTDFLDGYFARKLQQVTWLGKLLDPFADKLMIVSVLYCYAFSGLLSVWLVLLVVVKELYMIVGASLLLRNDQVVCADWFGKIATALFIPAAILIYPFHSVIWILQLGYALIYLSVFLSIVSAVHYTVCALRNGY